MQRVSGRLALLWDLARCSPSSLLCGRDKECGLSLSFFLSLLPPLARTVAPSAVPGMGAVVWRCCGRPPTFNSHPCPALYIYLFSPFFLPSSFFPSSSSQRASLPPSRNPKAVLQFGGGLQHRYRQAGSDYDRAANTATATSLHVHVPAAMDHRQRGLRHRHCAATDGNRILLCGRWLRLREQAHTRNTDRGPATMLHRNSLHVHVPAAMDHRQHRLRHRHRTATDGNRIVPCGRRLQLQWET